MEGIEALKSLIPHSARLGVYIKYQEKNKNRYNRCADARWFQMEMQHEIQIQKQMDGSRHR